MNGLKPISRTETASCERTPPTTTATTLRRNVNARHTHADCIGVYSVSDTSEAENLGGVGIFCTWISTEPQVPNASVFTCFPSLKGHKIWPCTTRTVLESVILFLQKCCKVLTAYHSHRGKREIVRSWFSLLLDMDALWERTDVNMVAT